MRALPEFRAIPVGLVAVYFLFAVALGAGGFMYYDHQKRQITEDRESELTAVARLKVSEISRWIKERKGDGQVIIENPVMGRHVRGLIENPESLELRQATESWLKSLKHNYDYRAVLLTDPAGKVVLSIPAARQIGPALMQYFPNAIASRRSAFYDFHIDSRFNGDSNSVTCGLIVPVFAGEHSGGPVVAALVLEIDPGVFLYPLIRSWPTPSQTAETLLVRREGDTVLFLNELRHQKHTALSLRLDANDIRLPAACAVQGHEGIFQGIDYRGKPVLAVTRNIPETPWFLVAKVDLDEMYESIRHRALPVALLTGILIMSAGISLFLVWHYQRAQFYKKQYELETERLELAERYELLTRYANDTIILADNRGHIKEVNERAVASYGYTREELLRMTVKSIRAPEYVADIEDQWRQIMEQNGMVFETIHQRKNGSLFPVEESARMIQLGGEPHYWGTIRDITERRQAEEALQQAHDELEIRVVDRTAALTQVNEQLMKEIAERKAVEEALRESGDQLHHLSSRLITVQEDERRRIARELHDSIGSSLSAIKFGLENNLDSVKSNPIVCESLITLISLSQQTIDEVRRIMADLRPSMLDDLGVVATVNWFCRQFQLVYPSICVETRIDIEEEQIPQPLKIVIFRVVQEAFNNIAKYSKAELVNLALGWQGSTISLSIEDSGEGFDLTASSSDNYHLKGVGLTSMRERTELSGGAFSVESVVGQGTLIRVSWLRNGLAHHS